MNLSDYFSYNPNTGLVVWKVSRNSRTKVGEQVGSLNSSGYRRVYLFGKHYFVHRLAWFLHYGTWPEKGLDHINNIPDDNRIENLREATSSQNSENRKRAVNNTSGIKGITWHKRDKTWQAALERNNKMIFVGYFKNLEDAKSAVEKKRSELHEEYANHG